LNSKYPCNNSKANFYNPLTIFVEFGPRNLFPGLKPFLRFPPEATQLAAHFSPAYPRMSPSFSHQRCHCLRAAPPRSASPSSPPPTPRAESEASLSPLRFPTEASTRHLPLLMHCTCAVKTPPHRLSFTSLNRSPPTTPGPIKGSEALLMSAATFPIPNSIPLCPSHRIDKLQVPPPLLLVAEPPQPSRRRLLLSVRTAPSPSLF
jgi:hypothetical protein